MGPEKTSYRVTPCQTKTRALVNYKKMWLMKKTSIFYSQNLRVASLCIGNCPQEMEAVVSMTADMSTFAKNSNLLPLSGFCGP
jgi:hypothetical protein